MLFSNVRKKRRQIFPTRFVSPTSSSLAAFRWKQCAKSLSFWAMLLINCTSLALFSLISFTGSLLLIHFLSITSTDTRLQLSCRCGEDKNAHTYVYTFLISISNSILQDRLINTDRISRRGGFQGKGLKTVLINMCRWNTPKHFKVQNCDRIDHRQGVVCHIHFLHFPEQDMVSTCWKNYYCCNCIRIIITEVRVVFTNTFTSDLTKHEMFERQNKLSQHEFGSWTKLRSRSQFRRSPK